MALPGRTYYYWIARYNDDLWSYSAPVRIDVPVEIPENLKLSSSLSDDGFELLATGEPGWGWTKPGYQTRIFSDAQTNVLKATVRAPARVRISARASAVNADAQKEALNFLVDGIPIFTVPYVSNGDKWLNDYWDGVFTNGLHVLEWNYSCEGFRKSIHFDGQYNTSFYLLGDVSINCTPMSFVRFDYNDGTEPSVRMVDRGEALVLARPSRRAGYSFEGWFTEPNGGDLIDSIIPTSDEHTLYAHWFLTGTAFVFDANGGVCKMHSIGADDYVGKLPIPTRDGYKFVGWFMDDGREVKENMVVSSVARPGQTCTVKARWVRAFSVLFMPGEYGSGAQLSLTKGVGQTLTLYGATFMRFGYVQTGWSTTDGGVKNYELGASYTVDAELTLYPYWEKDTASISDVRVLSGYPWKEVVLGYTITGKISHGAVLEVSAKDIVSGKTYECKTLENVMCTEGRHVIKWNASVDGAKFVSDNVVFTMRLLSVSVPKYCVIDLEGGTSAARYPVTEMADVPTGGWTDEYKTTKMVLRRIAAGTFKMQNRYEVTLTHPFYIGVFEVTQKQYELVMGRNPSSFVGDMRPVERVSYESIRGEVLGSGWPANNAVDESSFIGKLRAKTGLDFDLPTEAQWEYACRAGTTSDYNNGGDSEEDLKVLGRCSGNVDDGENQHTVVVGSYIPNAWGLFDMHGNVFEWCLDWYGELGALTDPRGENSGWNRVERGGCWGSAASGCTSFCRSYLSSSLDTYNTGFRLSRIIHENNGGAGIELISTALSESSTVDTTFEDGRNVDAPVRIAYGCVNVTDGCRIMANGMEIVNSSASGTVEWSPTAVGENLLSYVSGGITMESILWVEGCTITFNVNGGESTPASVQKGKGFAYGQLPTATRTGYQFLGWYTAAIGGTQVITTTIVTGDATLYARWTPNSYSIRFDSNGGTGSMANEAMTYDVAKALTTCAFTRKGYTFAGWATSAGGAVKYVDGASVKNLAASGTVTLYAQWTPNSYVVDFNPGQGGEGSMSDQPMTYDEEVALYLNLFHRTGYTFLGWTDDENELEEVLYYDGVVVSNLTDEVNGEFDLYAVWAANAYTVKFDANGGTGTMADQAFLYDEEQALRANAFARTGYSFAGWAVGEGADSTVLGDGEVVSNLTAEADGVVTLYAVWQGNPYTVRFDANGGEGTMGDLNCMYGTAKALTACAFTRTCYTFAGWAKSAGGAVMYADRASVTDVAASGTVTLYAKWNPIAYSVKFNANGGKGAMANQTFLYDEEQGLRANAFTRTGYAFAGWATSEDGAVVYTDGQSVKNLTEDADGGVNLYAVWKVNAYKLTAKPKSTKYGLVSGSGTYDYGTKVTLKATAKDGYVFTGWYTDADCTQKLNPEGYDNRKPTIKYAMPAKATTVYAKFNSVATDKSGLKFSDSTAKLATTPKAYAANAKVSLALGFSSKSYPKVTATKLPDGLSIDSLTGKITGAVKKPGAYTAKVTVTSAAGNKITQNVKIDIKAPSWAYGTFCGYGAVIVKGKTVPVSATFTATEVGKVSGKVTYKGTACAFTANYASATDAEARFTVSFTAGGVAFKSAMSIKQKTSGLTYTRAHALKADSFELEMQKVVPLVQTGKSLAGMIGKSYVFKYGYENAGLRKSGDKLVVKFYDRDTVKLSGIVGGTTFSGLSVAAMACGKSKTETTTKYKLNVPVVEPTTKYYRLLTFKVTIETATKKVTKIEKAFGEIE